MILSVLAPQTTDTPVWWLFGATVVLAVVTAVLVYVACRALGQLEEVKKDRLVDVFSDFGLRWEGPEMTDALAALDDYTPRTLADFFGKPPITPSRNPWRERRRRIEARRRLVLLRVPTYFEDAATIAKVGGLEGQLFKENFGGVAVDAWRAWCLAVREMQEFDNLAFVEFERLAKEVEAEDKVRLAGATEAADPS